MIVSFVTLFDWVGTVCDVRWAFWEFPGYSCTEPSIVSRSGTFARARSGPTVAASSTSVPDSGASYCEVYETDACESSRTLVSHTGSGSVRVTVARRTHR